MREMNHAKSDLKIWHVHPLDWPRLIERYSIQGAGVFITPLCPSGSQYILSISEHIKMLESWDFPDSIANLVLENRAPEELGEK